MSCKACVNFDSHGYCHAYSGKVSSTDICGKIIPKDDSVVVLHDGWRTMGFIYPSNPKYPRFPNVVTNCKNCAAPVVNGVCQYCGTRY